MGIVAGRPRFKTEVTSHRVGPKFRLGRAAEWKRTVEDFRWPLHSWWGCFFGGVYIGIIVLERPFGSSRTEVTDADDND
jgi:hypothetical protein